jgi:predicted nuclease with TOPRIM domain
VKRYAYVFTLNNPQHADYVLLGDKAILRDIGVEFVGYGIEYGTKNKTLHLQGVVILTRATTIRGLRKKFLSKAHFEEMRGTFDEAVEYCKKDGEYTQLYIGDQNKVADRLQKDALSNARLENTSDFRSLSEDVTEMRKLLKQNTKAIEFLYKTIKMSKIHFNLENEPELEYLEDHF